MNSDRLELIAAGHASIPEAVRNRLAKILAVGGLPATHTSILGLWVVAGRIVGTDYKRKRFDPGRPPDVAGDVVIEQLYHFWLSIKGRPPGISRPFSGGEVGGPFVRFAVRLAAEILADLEAVPPLGPKRPTAPRESCLRTSLRQIANRPDKVCERLKSIRRLWLLHSSQGAILTPALKKPRKVKK